MSLKDLRMSDSEYEGEFYDYFERIAEIICDVEKDMKKCLSKCYDSVEAIDDFCNVYGKTKCLKNDMNC